MLLTHRPKFFYSGGQTGSDIGGLSAAKKLGIPTGGTAPKGYMTELGPKAEILKSFGLIESHSAKYDVRTEKNVVDSDMTLIFSTLPSTDGTKLTIRLCEKHSRPFMLIDPYSIDYSLVSSFVNTHKPDILNIAGNRESRSPGIAKSTARAVFNLFYQPNC